MMSEASDLDVGAVTSAIANAHIEKNDDEDVTAENKDDVKEEDDVQENGEEEESQQESAARMNSGQPQKENGNNGNGEKKEDEVDQVKHDTSHSNKADAVGSKDNGQPNSTGIIRGTSQPYAVNQKTIKDKSSATGPVEIRPVPIGDTKARSKVRFEVVTARVIETGGKKHVTYTIMMKRVGHDARPAVIERRYNDFCFIYECILRSFHPSILGDFLFPKKVLIGNFKAEVISERTDAFHKFLNLIASCDSLLYSDYFYSFLSSEEHNEAVSHIKLARYGEAVPLLETIFHVREKLLTISSVHVLLCLCELVACLASVDRREEAFAYTAVVMQSFDLVRGHPEAEPLRVPFLKLAVQLAVALGHEKKPYERQLSEMRYAGVRLENAATLLEVIRDRYIHRASHTSKIS